MKRIEFIRKCGAGCVGAAALPAFLEGCAGTKYIQAPIEASHMIVPMTAFQIIKNERVTYRKYVIAQNIALQFPICIYRMTEEQYHALWMRCTHQGNELQVFGDKLQCPAHGSEFNSSGAVQNGPADEPLRTFAVIVSGEQLEVSLQ